MQGNVCCSEVALCAWRGSAKTNRHINIERIKINNMRKSGCLILLHGLFFIYALTGLGGKIAAAYAWDSGTFWGIYCGIIAILAIYAIGWQRILRYVPLSVAYSHRAVKVFWGLFFGYFFFDEPITLGKVAGVMIVMCGLVLFNMDWQTNDA